MIAWEAEFVAAYNRAVEETKKPVGDDLAALAARYRGLPEFKGLAASTRAEWNRWLDRIAWRTTIPLHR